MPTVKAHDVAVLAQWEDRAGHGAALHVALDAHALAHARLDVVDFKVGLVGDHELDLAVVVLVDGRVDVRPVKRNVLDLFKRVEWVRRPAHQQHALGLVDRQEYRVIETLYCRTTTTRKKKPGK